MLKIFRAVFLLIILAICFSQPENTAAYFSKVFLAENNKLATGDWTGPTLAIVEAPQGNIAYENLKLRVRGEDSLSVIDNFEYFLYSHVPGDISSDWIKPLEKIYCDSSGGDGLVKEMEMELSLDKIENSNHKLCATDENWCEGKPLPPGDYYLIIRAHDSSKILDPSGNGSEDLIYQFEKKEVQIICQPGDIKAKAGEMISFPDIICPNEPELSKISWDLDVADGVDFVNPDLSGNAPFLEEGILIPGTYSAFVKAENAEGLFKERTFTINISNPSLSPGDLVINEFIPNPEGDDKALMPEGEWIEIYNKLATGVDLLGFVFYDTYDSHDLPLDKTNCQDNSTLISPYSYKLIYRNGDPIFSINNSGPEKIRFFSGFIENEETLLDSYEYLGSVTAGMSLARIPDLTGNFQKIVPTPGAENKTP